MMSSSCSSLTIRESIPYLHVLDDFNSSPPTNQLPSVKPSKYNHEIQLIDKDSIPETNQSFINSNCSSPSNQTSTNGSVISNENPFLSNIISASWLTSSTNKPSIEAWADERNVFSVTLSIKNSGIIYNPGDSIGIIAPNPREVVMELIHLLQLSHSSTYTSIEFNETTYIRTRCLPSGFARPSETMISLENLLSYRVDLLGPIRKLGLVPLWEYCSDIQDKYLLQWLCSKSETGKKLWSECVEKQGLGIVELLRSFPSCKPPLTVLLSCCTGMRPRYYSICSSPLVSPDSLVVALSLERFSCPIPSATVNGTTTSTSSVNGNGNGNGNADPTRPMIHRSGLCTNYLYNICSRWLQPHATTDSDIALEEISNGIITPSSTMSPSVHIFHKSTLTFHLPGSVGPPLILIGPGTGVAPFIGFLEHRHILYQQHQQSLAQEVCIGTWRGSFELDEKDLRGEANHVMSYIESIPSGPIRLFFGCRGHHDFLFKEKLEFFQKEGILTSLDVAMSRVNESKEYVTDRIRARGNEIWELLSVHGAHVYICGDGNNMAKDVQSEFLNIFMSYGGMEEEFACEYLQDLKLRRRYLLDIWG